MSYEVDIINRKIYGTNVTVSVVRGDDIKGVLLKEGSDGILIKNGSDKIFVNWHAIVTIIWEETE